MAYYQTFVITLDSRQLAELKRFPDYWPANLVIDQATLLEHREASVEDIWLYYIITKQISWLLIDLNLPRTALNVLVVIVEQEETIYLIKR